MYVYILIYIRVCICVWCMCVCELENQIFLQLITKILLQKVPGLLHFESCQNFMSTANRVAEIQLKLLNEKKPLTYEYLTFLQSYNF